MTAGPKSNGSAGNGRAPNGSARHDGERPCPGDLGDLMVLLLTSTMAGLRDRLWMDGFDRAAELVAELVEAADDYITRYES